MERFEKLEFYCSELRNFNIPEDFMLDDSSYNDKVINNFKLILESLVISLTNDSNSLFDLPQFTQFRVSQLMSISEIHSKPTAAIQLEIINLLINLLNEIFNQSDPTGLTEFKKLKDLLLSHRIDVQLDDSKFVNTIAHILCIDINTIITILYRDTQDSSGPTGHLIAGVNKYLRGGAAAYELTETEQLLNKQAAQYDETPVDIEELREPSDAVRDYIGLDDRQTVFKHDKGRILLKAHLENERDSIRGKVIETLQTEGKKLEGFKETFNQTDIEKLISTFANQMQLFINFIITYYTKNFLAQLDTKIIIELLMQLNLELLMQLNPDKVGQQDESVQYKHVYNLIFIICMIIVSNYYRYDSTQDINYAVLEVLKINKSSYEHQYFDILHSLFRQNAKREKLYNQFITQLHGDSQYIPLINLLQANIQSVSSLVDIIRSYIEKIKILRNSVIDNSESLPKCQFDITPDIEFILQLKVNRDYPKLDHEGKCLYSANSSFIENILDHFENIIYALTLFQYGIFDDMRKYLPRIIVQLKDIPTQILALLEDLDSSMVHTGGATADTADTTAAHMGMALREQRQQESVRRHQTARQQVEIVEYDVATYYILDIVSWLILEAIFIQKSLFSMIFVHIVDSINSQQYQVLFTGNVNRFDINCKIIMFSICKLIKLLILLCEDVSIEEQTDIYDTFINNLFHYSWLRSLTIIILYYITGMDYKKKLAAYYRSKKKDTLLTIEDDKSFLTLILHHIISICKEFTVTNSEPTQESGKIVFSTLNMLKQILLSDENNGKVQLNNKDILNKILDVLTASSPPTTLQIGLQNVEQVLIILSADILSQPTVCLRVANTNPTLVRDNDTTTKEQFMGDLRAIKELYIKANEKLLQVGDKKALQLVTGGVVPAEYTIQYFESNAEIQTLSGIKKDRHDQVEDFAGQDKSIVFVSYYRGGVYKSAVYYCTKVRETTKVSRRYITKHFIQYNFLGTFDVFTDTVYYAQLDEPNQQDCLKSLMRNNGNKWPELFFKRAKPLYLDVSSISLLYGQLVKTPSNLMLHNVLTGGYIKGNPDVPSYILHAVKGLLESVNKLFSKKKLITSTYGASGSGKTYNFFGASDADSTTFGLFQEIIIYILARQHYVVFKNVFDVYGNVTLFNRRNKFSFSTLPLTLQSEYFSKSADTSKHNYANSRYMTHLFEQCIFAYQVSDLTADQVNSSISHDLPQPLKALLYYMVAPEKGKKLNLSQHKFTPHYKYEPKDPFKVAVTKLLLRTESYDDFESQMAQKNRQYTSIYLKKRLYEIYAIFNQHVKKHIREEEHWIETKMETENYDPHLYLSCFNEAEQVSLLPASFGSTKAQGATPNKSNEIILDIMTNNYGKTIIKLLVKHFKFCTEAYLLSLITNILSSLQAISMLSSIYQKGLYPPILEFFRSGSSIDDVLKYITTVYINRDFSEKFTGDLQNFTEIILNIAACILISNFIFNSIDIVRRSASHESVFKRNPDLYFPFKVAQTPNNPESSRSAVFFNLHVYDNKERPDEDNDYGELYLCDTAGAENTKNLLRSLANEDEAQLSVTDFLNFIIGNPLFIYNAKFLRSGSQHFRPALGSIQFYAEVQMDKTPPLPNPLPTIIHYVAQKHQPIMLGINIKYFNNVVIDKLKKPIYELTYSVNDYNNLRVLSKLAVILNNILMTTGNHILAKFKSNEPITEPADIQKIIDEIKAFGMSDDKLLRFLQTMLSASDSTNILLLKKLINNLVYQYISQQYLVVKPCTVFFQDKNPGHYDVMNKYVNSIYLIDTYLPLVFEQDEDKNYNGLEFYSCWHLTKEGVYSYLTGATHSVVRTSYKPPKLDEFSTEPYTAEAYQHTLDTTYNIANFFVPPREGGRRPEDESAEQEQILESIRLCQSMSDYKVSRLFNVFNNFAVQYMFTFKNSVLNLCQKMVIRLKNERMFSNFESFNRKVRQILQIRTFAKYQSNDAKPDLDLRIQLLWGQCIGFLELLKLYSQKKIDLKNLEITDLELSQARYEHVVIAIETFLTKQQTKFHSSVTNAHQNATDLNAKVNSEKVDNQRTAMLLTDEDRATLEPNKDKLMALAFIILADNVLFHPDRTSLDNSFIYALFGEIFHTPFNTLPYETANEFNKLAYLIFYYLNLSSEEQHIQFQGYNLLNSVDEYEAKSYSFETVTCYAMDKSLIDKLEFLFKNILNESIYISLSIKDMSTLFSTAKNRGLTPSTLADICKFELLNPEKNIVNAAELESRLKGQSNNTLSVAIPPDTVVYNTDKAPNLEVLPVYSLLRSHGLTEESTIKLLNQFGLLNLDILSGYDTNFEDVRYSFADKSLLQLRVNTGTVQYGGATKPRVGSPARKLRARTPDSQSRTSSPASKSRAGTPKRIQPKVKPRIIPQPFISEISLEPANPIVVPGDGNNDIYSMTLVGQIFAYVHQKKPSDKCVQFSKIITIRGEGLFHINQKSWEATLSTLKVAQALTQF